MIRVSLIKLTVGSAHTAVGGLLSSTVTVAVQVLVLPFTSVTVSVSVLGPTSEQSKLVWLKERLRMPQASPDPLFTAAAVAEPLPLASSCTVRFWQRAVGATLSSTVIVASQVLKLPFTSVTVSVDILFSPTSLQVKAVAVALRLAIPPGTGWDEQLLAVEPPLISEPRIEALPVALSCTVRFWQRAVGGVLSNTLILILQVSRLPVASSAVQRS